MNLLAQSRQGVDLSTALFYRKERFTGDDGLVQGVLALGRRFGRIGLFAMWGTRRIRKPTTAKARSRWRCCT